MQWSRRTEWEPEDTGFAEAVGNYGLNLIDLTVSNPTACGLQFSADVASALAGRDALTYTPDALGMLPAREAVCSYYAERGAALQPDRVCLTSSTSEAYSYLFRLLCDPGDEVLVASPSYPLFNLLADLEGVHLVHYPLLYDDGWTIDLHALEALFTPRTRAVVVVHPNNPTGNYVSAMERLHLTALCAERGVALIVDEVFLDFSFAGNAREAHTFAGESAALTFVLSGVSKVCGLPQMKCSWMSVSGPEEVVREAMRRLEIIADTFLSVAGPVQHALPAWLRECAAFQQQVRERTVENLACLARYAGAMQADVQHAAGGWTAVLRVPRAVAGLPFAEWALSTEVLVQPGVFYGMSVSRVVVSLLTPPERMERGLQRIASAMQAAGER